jgi:methyltransferase (TIGR00027 family)
MVARSRYAEDQLAKAVEQDVAQYVVLGAGLDTFACRNPDSTNLRVFEVDHPATQAWKLERLQAAGIAIPQSLSSSRSISSGRHWRPDSNRAASTQARPRSSPGWE